MQLVDIMSCPEKTKVSDMVGDEGKFFIKQFGLQRSGTNAVKALLEVNFPDIRVLTTYLGNKHKPTNYQSLVDQSDDPDFQEYDLTSNLM